MTGYVEGAWWCELTYAFAMRLTKNYLSLCFIAVLSLLGCAAPEIDSVLLETSLQGAQQAIATATELEAERMPIEEFGRAVKLLALAEKAQENGDIAQSAEFAAQAALVAQIAQAKARQHQAWQRRVNVREQAAQARINELTHQRDIASTRHEITKVQLTRAATAMRQSEARKDALAADVTELTASLQRTELQVTISSAALLVDVAKTLYPPIEATADYERAQATLALAVTLIGQADADADIPHKWGKSLDFTAADNTTADAQQQANALYELALQNQQTEHAAKTEARVAIAKAELVIQRAQYLSANQHALQPLQEASTHLKNAQQHFDASQYQQARRAATASLKSADTAVAIAEVAEYRQRAQKELAESIAEARAAIDAAQKELAAQAKTDVPRLEPRLYQLATDALAAAKTASAARNYPAALQAAQDSRDTLKRALANVQQLTTAKTELLRALQQLPRVTEVVERDEGVLLRISGTLFAAGSTTLKKEFFPTFAQLSKVLRRAAFAGYPILIEAHTATIGPAGVNKHISQGRADAVREFLVEEGAVDTNRLTAVGLGEEQSLGEAEELNRRIEIFLSIALRSDRY